MSVSYQRRRWLRIAGDVLINASAVFVVMFVLFPMVWLYMTSIKLPVDIFALPPVWIPLHVTGQGFADVIFGNSSAVGQAYLALENSIIATLCSTVLAVLIGVCAAYGFARYRFRGAQLLLIGILFVRMIPGIMLVIPLFLLASATHLIDTRLALVIVYTAFELPFAIWLLYGALVDFPSELEDAGRIDGCSDFGILWRIVLPLIRPALAAAAVLTFLMSWNDFLFALVLTRTFASVTIPVTITQLVTFQGVNWQDIAAEAVLMTGPALLFSIIIQRHIVKGLTLGAIKG